MNALALLLASVAAAAVHPLDPLDADEVPAAVAAVRAAKDLPEGVFFPVVTLDEPAKKEVLAWKPGRPFPRRAFVTVYDRAKNETAEAVVDLETKALASWTPRPGAQPNVMLEEFEKFPAVVKADPRWRAAMEKRGLKPDAVWVDLWAPGPTSAAEAKSGARLLRGLSYATEGNTNAYAHPVEGVVAVIDANKRAVVEFIDTGVVAVSTAPGDFDPSAVPAARPGLRPLVVSQPDGPSFTLDGHEVRWQGWRFRWALHPREGPVLYQVGFEDGGVVRPVLYRASLSEMLVPYGDPDSNWSFRNAFDEGEYGIGRMAGPLVPGADAPANAVYRDATFADDLGKSYKAERAVAFYERDGGILWKHLDMINGRSESRRGRELVMTFVATISNYDYQLSWVFKQDGALLMESGLTGIMLAKGVKAATASELGADHAAHHAHLVAPGVAAPHHQHFFNFRLDFDVDGPANRVVEHEVFSAPKGKANPLSNAIVMRETVIARESAARRDMDLSKARKWRVLSSTAKNALGEPTGFVLIPGENSRPYLLEDSPVRRKGRFIEHHLWVTRHDDAELYAAGRYPNQGAADQGLPAWQKADRALDGEDVVLWYTFGVTHIPRPEDWPVMPTHKTGFQLLPSGFFHRNPALDIR
ncbi:MAG: primary-amine oxidase [Elusimicrobiota bacterium]|nr:primary-amine oxidase [Elusimicrobiota bacterium]